MEVLAAAAAAVEAALVYRPVDHVPLLVLVFVYILTRIPKSKYRYEDVVHFERHMALCITRTHTFGFTSCDATRVWTGGRSRVYKLWRILSIVLLKNSTHPSHTGLGLGL